MNTAIQFFGSTLSGIPLASPMEPETTRAILNYRPRPKVVDQFNIDGWIKDIKTAAGLPHGIDNLDTVFDVVYLFGVNNRYNAKIDFVTGTLLAEEVNMNSDDYLPWEGFYSSASQSRAVNTKWNVTNPNNKGIANYHHVHFSSLTDTAEPQTTSIGGITQYGLIPGQRLSGVLNFRFRSGSTNIISTPNDNVLGSYTVTRETETIVSYQKNQSTKLTWNRPYTAYENLEFYMLGENQNNLPSTTRGGMKVGTFTAGSAIVDGALMAAADKNYFAKYGITIY